MDRNQQPILILNRIFKFQLNQLPAMKKIILVSILLCLTAILPGTAASRKSATGSKSNKSQSSSQTLNTQSVINDDGSVYITSTLEDGTIIITVVDSDKNVTQTRVNGYTRGSEQINKETEKQDRETLQEVNNLTENARKSAEKAVRETRAAIAIAVEEAQKQGVGAAKEALEKMNIYIGEESVNSNQKKSNKKRGGAVTLFSGKPVRSIRNMGKWDIEIKGGTTPRVEVQGLKSGKIPSKMIEYENGEVQIRSDVKIDADEDVKITIYTPELRSLYTLGSGDIIADCLTGGELDVCVLGSGDILANEIKSGNLRLMITGSGDISGKKVEATTLQAVVNGSGDILVNKAGATSIECVVQGSGDIFLRGIEATTVRVTSLGSGDVTVTGKTTTASYSVRGSGDINMGGLKAVRSTSTSYGEGEILY